jgi:hypothetical protein
MKLVVLKVECASDGTVHLFPPLLLAKHNEGICCTVNFELSVGCHGHDASAVSLTSSLVCGRRKFGPAALVAKPFGGDKLSLTFGFK